MLVILGLLKFVKKENGLVPAIWGVKQPRDHLPIYKLDLPDPIFGVPDLKKGNLRAKKQKKLIILGLLKFVKNSPIKPVLGSVGTGPYIVLQSQNHLQGLQNQSLEKEPSPRAHLIGATPNALYKKALT